ncbi:hypothetical protein THF1C08_70027 [Vibrio jasicida]|uniref:Uncharacterized protein n=1 Tax=Vibrio jasicida TaxID=766224 RepID=A0AAU9QVP5_9VIBR|nr:hypothetical protein THF1C08_70027 [Vibrio jasicida]CAH1602553.1 hypothetical protein THF1A12_60029 [Vibrio jasicida]
MKNKRILGAPDVCNTVSPLIGGIQKAAVSLSLFLYSFLPIKVF